ncbi:MAG: FecR domain-containing protein [Acidobacteria bacterium]|nr:FecR domain-containing protein [Acidobacteriota bacterium]
MRRLLAILIIVAAAATPGLASNEDDLTSLSYISYMERYATVRSASQTESAEAVINMPLIPGDRLDTAREARVEVQLADGSTLWLDEYTSVSFDALAFSRGDAADRTVLFFGDGGMVLEIPTTALTSKPTRVDTASSTVYLSRPGIYRLEALRNGGLRVEVWNGHAEVATPEGGAAIEAGSAAEVAAGSVERTEAVLTRDDAFARWVEGRRQPGGGNADLHMDERYARQEAVLDSYGGWIYVDDLGGYAWQPTVSAGWTPYTYGRWGWTPAGWSWISYEPWGWMPYHYGSWYFSVGFGWVWSWGSYWGPAWVDWAWWPGYVGWCPMGYYDHWYWNRYPGYPTTPGHPSPHPGARDRVPGPINGVGRPGTRPPIRVDRFALGFEGRARLRDVDPRGWNVVRADDFTNPHLPRLVTPGRDVFPRLSPDVRGVVRAGPLLTARPTARNVGTAIQRPFREAGNRASKDLTPILARDPSLPAARAGELVRPTTQSGLIRSARERSGLSGALRSDGRSTGGGHLSSTTPSRTVRGPGGLGTLPRNTNLYRPTLRHTGDGSVVPTTRGRSGLSRPASTDPRRSGSVSPSRSSPSPATSPRHSGEIVRPNPTSRDPVHLRGGSLRTPAGRREPLTNSRSGDTTGSYGGFVRPAPRSNTRSASPGASRPSYGGFLRPSTPSRPSSRSYSRPSSRSYSRPSSRSYSRPSSRSYSRPSSRSYSRPSSRSYSRPSSRSYSRPSGSSSHRSSGRRH